MWEIHGNPIKWMITPIEPPDVSTISLQTHRSFRNVGWVDIPTPDSYLQGLLLPPAMLEW